MFKKKIIGGMAVMALLLGSVAIPTVTGATQTSVIEALDGTFDGFNNFTSANNSFYLGQVLDQVWPSPYIYNNLAKLVLDTDIVTSAKSALVNGQQVVTYVINPKAVWSDGVPLTADDFIYMWQASSGYVDGNGNPIYTDVDGTPFDVAGNAGYNQIESVVGSKPNPTYTTVKGKTITHAGVCDAGSNKDYNTGLCPNGKTVTVTFAAGENYAEWPGLFALIPAHISRVVGWNTGMNDPASAVQNIVSAGPYVLSSVDQSNNTYIETKNPLWWDPATAGKVDDLVFTNLADDTQGVAGLAAGDFNVFNPTSTTGAIVAQANGQNGVSKSIIPAYTFEHLDFNVSHSPWMAELKVRQAIADAVDRQAIINATVGQVTPGITPLDNYIFMSNQSGYSPDLKAYDTGGSDASDAKAIALLKTVSGLFYCTSDKMFHTGTSCSDPLLSFVLQHKNSSARNIEGQLIQADLAKVGIDVQIVIRSNATLADENYDMVIFGWAGSPLLSGYINIYGCTDIGDGNGCVPNASNYGQIRLSGASAAMAAANTSLTISDEVNGYKAVDKTLANALPTLPLYQSPEGIFWSGVSGIVGNPTSSGVTWNAQNWTTN